MSDLISVKTDVPFYLRLPPYWFISHDAVKSKCAILCSHRFGEIRFNKNTKMYNNSEFKEFDKSNVTKPYKEYKYKTTNNYRDIKDEITTAEINVSKDGGFKELKTYTEFDMLLYWDGINKIDELILKERISNNLNHFLNIYRLVTQDPYVTKIDFDLDLYIVDIRVCKLLPNLKDLPIEKIIRDINKIKFMDNIGLGRATIQRLDSLEDIWPGKDLDKSFLDTFSNLIQNEYKMPLHYELILLAQTYLKKRIYHISIILAETAFEIYIENILRDIFISEGKSETDIDNLLGFEGSYGSHNSRLYFLDKLLYKKFNSRNGFINSIEYKNWNNDLYLIRNDIVHRGIIYEISFKKCQKAIKACKEAVSFFERRIGSFANNIQICTDVSFLIKTAGRISSFL